MLRVPARVSALTELPASEEAVEVDAVEEPVTSLWQPAKAVIAMAAAIIAARIFFMSFIPPVSKYVLYLTGVMLRLC